MPQLRMGFRAFGAIPASPAAAGYTLRSFRPGDEDAWIAILQTADFGEWDRARLDRMISGDRAPMPYEGIVFATKGDVPVGCACTFFYRSDEPPVAEIGWVAVLPEHRGQRLAGAIVAECLRFVHAQRIEYAYLKTEDYRIAAIKTYLALGFEPEIVHESHEAWWRDFRAAATPP